MSNKPIEHKWTLHQFANKYQGQRAFILGNGPSLSQLDLRLLKNEITFGVNSLFYHFNEMGFKPTFYVVEDTLVAEDRAQEINQLDGMIKVFGSYLDYCIEDGEDIIWADVIFNYDEYPGFPHFSRNAAHCMWVGGTVSYLNLQLAYMMGFEEVYLLGFDHAYTIPDDSQIDGTVITSQSNDPNHFHPDYFGAGKRWHHPRLDRMEKAYKKAKVIFEEDHRSIFNATRGGKLDVFPRVEFDSLFRTDEMFLSVAASPSRTTERSQRPTSPLFSVVVCTHKNPTKLVSTLESLRNQSIGDDKYEVIIIDNHSQDDTGKICACYPEFLALKEEQLGLSFARNTGILNARGKYIAFIDDDAEADPFWLEALYAQFQNNEDTWACGGKVAPIWDAPKPDWLTEEFYRSLSLIDWGEHDRPLAWPERIIGTNCCFRREVFEEIGYFDTSLGRVGNALMGNEDTEIQERIHSLEKTVQYTPDAIVHHHVPPERMTHEYFHRRDEGHQVTQEILRLRETGDPEAANQKAQEYSEQISLVEKKQAQEESLVRSSREMGIFHNVHRGQRCVIIGNGPSLNRMDLSFLKNEITFATNRIYLGFEKFDFVPDYYVCVNPLVIKQSVEEIQKIPSVRFISQHGVKHLPDEEHLYFLKSLDEPSFSLDPGSGIWEGYTVTYVCMQLAYFMGFEEVLLIGCDHNFVTEGPANAEVISSGEDPNHFDGNYFGKGTHWHLPDLTNSEMAYRLAREVFQSDRRLLLDATVDGKLDVFPKADYRQVFALGEFSEPGKNGLSTPLNLTYRQLIEISPVDEILISAVVSTYNSSEYLAACLEDLESQTIADKMEILVVDSGSEQNEKKIVQEFAQNYNNIRYLPTERESVYQSWNRGFLAARGRYITNANTDDGHRRDALEIMVAALENNPHADLAYSNCDWTHEPNDNFPPMGFIRRITHQTFHPADAMLFCMLGPHPVWRRKVLKSLGLFDARYQAAGDYEYLLRFVEAGLQAVLIPESLSLFYQNPSGLTLASQRSHQEVEKINLKYRQQIPIERLYRVDPSNQEVTARAWVAQGNRAAEYRVPWLDHRDTDPNYAMFCFLKALEIYPSLEALNNLIGILGRIGDWGQCANFLDQLDYEAVPQLFDSVRSKTPLALVNVPLPPAVEPLIYLHHEERESIPSGMSPYQE
jgi:glycosyltransferase involved in cell wall biosynthesis